MWVMFCYKAWLQVKVMLHMPSRHKPINKHFPDAEMRESCENFYFQSNSEGAVDAQTIKQTI
jgi:hypothetical protein